MPLRVLAPSYSPKTSSPSASVARRRRPTKTCSRTSMPRLPATGYRRRRRATTPTSAGNRLPGPIVVGSLGAGALPPATAYGVEVGGSRTFNTFMGSIFSLVPGGTGVAQFTATAKATAIAGQVKGICPGDAPCGFLPVTFPTNLTLCDGSGKQVSFGVGNPYRFGNVGDPNSEVILPLCKTGPGTVGWLDIDSTRSRHATAVAPSSSHARSGRQEIPACRRRSGSTQ